MISYNPFDDILELRNIVDRYFNGMPVYQRRRDYPYVAFYEGNDEIEVRALLAGVRPEDVNLQLVDDSLVIDGEKKSDYSDKPYLRKERAFGKFKKAIKLPYRVEAGDIRAEIKNGILFVNLKRAEETKPKKIVIN